MKIFTNRKIWQKIIIVILIVLTFQIFIPKPAHAIPGDVLLEPVTNLFANLGDGIMNIMQRTFMGMETSGAWVETSSNLWLKILVIAAAILVATVAIAATILSGGAALTIVLGVASAVVKIGIGTAVAFFAVDTLHFGESGFYLPEFELTPQAIFQDEILAFDVNFFNPKKDKVTKTKSTKEEIETISNDTKNQGRIFKH